MKRSRFTEEQIIGILKEQEAGAKTADVQCAQLLDRRQLDFSGSDHDGGLAAPPGLCNAIGTLYPIAE